MCLQRLLWQDGEVSIMHCRNIRTVSWRFAANPDMTNTRTSPVTSQKSSKAMLIESSCLLSKMNEMKHVCGTFIMNQLAKKYFKSLSNISTHLHNCRWRYRYLLNPSMSIIVFALTKWLICKFSSAKANFRDKHMSIQYGTGIPHAMELRICKQNVMVSVPRECGSGAINSIFIDSKTGVIVIKFTIANVLTVTAMNNEMTPRTILTFLFSFSNGYSIPSSVNKFKIFPSMTLISLRTFPNLGCDDLIMRQTLTVPMISQNPLMILNVGSAVEQIRWVFGDN